MSTCFLTVLYVIDEKGLVYAEYQLKQTFFSMVSTCLLTGF